MSGQTIPEDWTEADVQRVLGMALARYENRRLYDWDTRRDVFSNGTEAEFAWEHAETLLDHGPMLRLVLAAGVRALAGHEDFQSYVMHLYSGNRDEIVRLEDKVRPEPKPTTAYLNGVEYPDAAAAYAALGDAMVADLHERYGVEQTDAGL